MHFCRDELIVILTIVPGLGFMLGWLKARLHHKRLHPICEAGEKEEGR